MNDILFTPIRLVEFESLIEKSVFRGLQLQQSQSSQSEQYISIAQASGLLSVSRVTIYEYIKAGKLKKFKIGSTTRLLKSEVLSIVEQA